MTMSPQSVPASSTAAATFRAPCFVLMDQQRRIGPPLVPMAPGHIATAIFGFSNKSAYDTFLKRSDAALTPYPLVQGYLRNQIDLSGKYLHLVVLDAVGAREPCLYAASVDAVLNAQDRHATDVAPEYRLIFDPGADAYRVEATPRSLGRSDPESHGKS